MQSFVGIVDTLTIEDLTSSVSKHVVQEVSSSDIEHETEIRKETIREVRPWIRFFARTTDYYIAAITLGFITGLFDPNALTGIPDLALGMSIIFIWVFIEAILFSSWGITPGKWLYKTTIRTNIGEKPTFSSAIGRSFSVWLKGYAIGIPLISLLTLLMAYDKLTKEHTTTWDKEAGLVVLHEKIGIPRIILIVLLYIFFIAMMILGLSPEENLPDLRL